VACGCGGLYVEEMDDPHPAPGPATAVTGHETCAHTVLAGTPAGGVIVLCDHASNRLPPGYGTLGLPEGELDRHIAYDIGAAGVTRTLAARLRAPAILSRFSRLLIDPNRGVDDPTLIMRISDGAVIEGNRHLDDAERAHRIATYYDPYHTAITGVIDASLAAGVVPLLVSIHSFTPVWKGVLRPWHGAILWDKDPRLALPLLAGLRREAGLVIGDNEPYSGILRGDTLWRHGTRRGLAHAIVEIRQDLIASPEGQDAWSLRLADLISDLLASPEKANALLAVAHHGSHTDI
jgi:predicted N-formylglutamate amidohydrolase